MQQKGAGKQVADALGVEPRRLAGMADEGDNPACAELGIERLEVLHKAGEGVEQVGHAHGQVVALLRWSILVQ